MKLRRAALLVLLIAAQSSWADSWNNPGGDRFTGSVPDAVRDYADIPPTTRQALQSRMERHDYDDRVTITRDSITGLWGYLYAPQITGMHFGSKGRVLAVAGRDKWPDDLKIEALAYTEDGFTIIVPAICGNVARVVRLPVAPIAAAPPAGDAIPGGGSPVSAPVAWPAFVRPTESTVVTYAPPAVGLLVLPWQPAVPWCCAPIVVPPIPVVSEPATWALLCAGLAFVLSYFGLRRMVTEGGTVDG